MIHTNQSDLRDMIRNLKKRKEKEKRPTIDSDPRQRSKTGKKLKQERCHTQNSQKTEKSCGVWERK